MSLINDHGSISIDNDFVNFKGMLFGGYKVISFSHFSYDKKGRKSHHYWNVECLHCKKIFSRQRQKVLESKLGCENCKGELQSGTHSVHWKGGEYVPGFFVAKIKKTAVRKSRTLEFNLSFKFLDDLWILQKGKCFYSGEDLWFSKSKVLGNASLDRIDSSRGYVEGNVQFVHKDINTMKWDLTEDRFINLCEKITMKRNGFCE